ncbi:hypothetical protein [Desulfosporosinus sp. FKB]|uniref:hypothetical protein n=1 Tax=Desulfosporosinus sp. FKB TaxID=1969835 RepID=UPI000B49FD6B|nr:hypothetical protein [Desulfosporosinus sp. FKB]
MGQQQKEREFQAQRQALLEERNKILEKLNLEKEHRIKWLLKFIDIEDKLEELTRSESLWINNHDD